MLSSPDISSDSFVCDNTRCTYPSEMPVHKVYVEMFEKSLYDAYYWFIYNDSASQNNSYLSLNFLRSALGSMPLIHTQRGARMKGHLADIERENYCFWFFGVKNQQSALFLPIYFCAYNTCVHCKQCPRVNECVVPNTLASAKRQRFSGAMGRVIFSVILFLLFMFDPG